MKRIVATTVIRLAQKGVCRDEIHEIAFLHAVFNNYAWNTTDSELVNKLIDQYSTNREA